MSPSAVRAVPLGVRLALVALLVLPAFAVHARPGVAQPDAGRARGPRWTYVVSPSADLARLDVEWCLEGFVPRRAWLADVLPLDAVTLGSSRGGALVRDPDDPPILLARGVEGDACFRYTVDLHAMARVGASRLVGRARLLRLGAFLVRAGVVPDDLDVTVSFRCPEGVDVAAPFDPAPGVRTFRVPPSTWEFQGWVVLGGFSRRSRSLAGCATEVLVFDGALACSADGVDGWLRGAMEANAHLFGGRYPRARLLVGVEPVRPTTDPVPFGSAWSGGGPHAMLQVAAQCRDDDFAADWTATHELLHAALPHIRLEDAWCAEGFVTYYQEVLRARSGAQSAQAAWQALHEGFARGRRSTSTRTIADDSRHMRERHEFLRIYWAGAALALRLDVAARRASGGRVSLDDAMASLPAHPAADRRSLSGREVVETLARLVPDADALGLTDALLRSAAFPEVGDAWRDLGLRVEGARVVLGEGPLSSVRDAIMRR